MEVVGGCQLMGVFQDCHVVTANEQALELIKGINGPGLQNGRPVPYGHHGGFF